MPEEIFFSLLNPEGSLYWVWFWMKIVFFGISAFFLSVIIYGILKTSWLNYSFMEDASGFMKHKPAGLGKISKKWNKIIKRVEEGSEDEYKLAVLEAEETLTEVLERLGYKGETLEEKLKDLPEETISNIENLKSVSEVKEKIVYNPEYSLSLNETKRILDIFNQSLKDLQAL
jgi:hypothetical protein